MAEGAGFQERQRELCLLSAYIKEQEQWVETATGRLGWSREGLETHKLVQCPINEHHSVSLATLEQHTLRCRYSAVGVDMEEVPSDGRAFYESSGVPSVEITSSIEQAVKRYVNERHNQDPSSHRKAVAPFTDAVQRESIDQSEVIVESHDSLITKEHFANLEDLTPAPADVLSWEPTQIIRYIKSWRLVPTDFATLHRSSAFDPTDVKAWLFKHLPEQHAYSSQTSGEIQAVDSILQSLNPWDMKGGGQTGMGEREGGGREGEREREEVKGVGINQVMTSLRPLLGLKTRPFLLELWKFLHICHIQKDNGIPDGTVESLTPLPLVPGRRDQTKEEQEKLVDKIKALAAEERGTQEPALSVPMATAQFWLSTEERRVMYDYVVGVSRKTGAGDNASELYWDSMATLKGRTEQSEAEKKSFLELLKEQRDHRRRRKSYRAKNAHITMRTQAELPPPPPNNMVDGKVGVEPGDETTLQVMRDIINARMEEIRAALGQPDVGEDEENDSNGEREASMVEESRKLDYHRRHDGGSHRERSRSPIYSSREGLIERDRDKRGRERGGERRGGERRRGERRDGRERDDIQRSKRIRSSVHHHEDEPVHSREKHRKQSRSRSRERTRKRHKHTSRHSRSRSRSQDGHRHKHKHKHKSKHDNSP